MLETEIYLRLMPPTLNVSLPVELNFGKIMKAHIDKRGFRLRIGLVVNEEAVTIIIRARREADIGAVVFGEAVCVVVPAEVARVKIEMKVVSESVAGAKDVLSLIRLEEEATRGCASDLKGQNRLLVQTKASVEAKYIAVLLDEVVGGGDHADGVFARSQIVLQSEHADVSLLVEEGRVIEVEAFIADKVARPLVARRHEAESIAAKFAGELDGHFRVDDGARMHDRERRLKNVYAFEEERAFLWKEDWKALISRDDCLIRFDLREVWIESEVERDGRR